MLVIKGLSKTYSPSKEGRVLNNYCAEFAQRDCLVGPNGIGKSTILLAISGLLSIDAGEILWQQQKTTAQQRKGLAALASDSIIIPEFLSPTQVFELNQATYNVAWPSALIKQFKFAQHLQKSVDALSSGSLKKLQLICAFMRNSQILLLDEPNIALDETSVEVLWSLIDQYKGCLIVASNEPQLFAKRGFTIKEMSVAGAKI